MERLAMQRFWTSPIATILFLLTALPLPVLADTVWVGQDAKKALERKNMRIEGMSDGGLLFRSVAADRMAEPKPLKEIQRIEVDDEPALNSAELAFSGGKWDQAVSGYQRSISTSRKDWVKQFATMRLITAAKNSGKFSAAAAAYAALVQMDPKAAVAAKPEIPEDAKSELAGAIRSVKSALAEPKLQAASKNPLQVFLAELYIANGQLKEAQALGGSVNPAPPQAARGADVELAEPAPVPSATDKGETELKLRLALASLKDKKYQETINTIESVSTKLTQPEKQAEALFLIAEARAGLAGDDPARLQDAALAYMRVVAHFKSQSDAPHIAESLFKAGAVLERAKLLPDALAAYRAVQNDFKKSPHAKEAAAAAARVQKAIEEAKG
jgi:TolA-binding protein